MQIERYVRNACGLTPLAIVAAVLLAGASGCQNVEKIEIPNIFRTVPERPLADVPVPVGFRYKQKGSYIFNNNFRVARLRYTGTPWPEDALAFFKQQMPLSHWQPIGEETRDGKQVLHFRNETERCDIAVDRARGLTELTIDISPRETAS